jgi:hypothetical protein
VSSARWIGTQGNDSGRRGERIGCRFVDAVGFRIDDVS